MLVASFTAFNDFVYGAAAVFSTIDLAAALGKYDQLSLQAVVDQVDAAGTLTVQILHSADGIHFKAKNATAEITGAAGALAANATSVCVGSDSSNAPSLAYVVLSLGITGATRAHIKLYVSARDSGAAGPLGLYTPPAPTAPMGGGMLKPPHGG